MLWLGVSRAGMPVAERGTKLRQSHDKLCRVAQGGIGGSVAGDVDRGERATGQGGGSRLRVHMPPWPQVVQLPDVFARGPSEEPVCLQN